MKKLLLLLFIGITIVSCNITKNSSSKFHKQSEEKIAVLINEDKEVYYSDLHQAFEKSEDGDIIYIREGAHLLESSLSLWEKKNVSIVGEGKCKLICNNSYDNVMWVITCENIIIRNIHATHTEPGEDLSCVGNVFALDMGSNITFQNCDINGCGAIGVYILGTNNIVLRNCILHDNTIWAVEDNGYGMLEAEQRENVSFFDCEFYNNGSQNELNQE